MENDEKTILYYTNNKNFARKRVKNSKIKNSEVLKVVDDQIIVNAVTVSRTEDDEGVTSNTFRKKREQGRTRWNKQEDEAFFKALECCGCEFSIMNILYPGRTRNNLREKYKRELKQNRSRVEAALRNFKNFDKEKLMKLKDQINDGHQLRSGACYRRQLRRNKPVDGNIAATTPPFELSTKIISKVQK